MTLVSGVESFHQGSHDVSWDLLVLLDQRLDCLLDLRGKNTSGQEQHSAQKSQKENHIFNPSSNEMISHHWRH